MVYEKAIRDITTDHDECLFIVLGGGWRFI
jgi:hypothetical protein